MHQWLVLHACCSLFTGVCLYWTDELHCDWDTLAALTYLAPVYAVTSAFAGILGLLTLILGV